MTGWQDYRAYRNGTGHTVVGNLMVWPEFFSPRLDNHRDILVYLPPSYNDGESRRYPVIYMQDGQNLFDAQTSFAGEWQVDETMESLSQEGLEAIIVGIPNAGVLRLDEYNPFDDEHMSRGNGEAYLAFVIHTLKSRIDADFRTRPEREYTGIMGSSMGGLISLYAFFQYADVFGLAGVMSPSLWFAHGKIYDYVRLAAFAPGRMYLDAGTRELGDGRGIWNSNRDRSRRYYASVRRMQRLLLKKGYRPNKELIYVEEKWARHEEGAWARRFPKAIRFLLSQPKPQPL